MDEICFIVIFINDIFDIKFVSLSFQAKAGFLCISKLQITRFKFGSLCEQWI